MLVAMISAAHAQQMNGMGSPVYGPTQPAPIPSGSDPVYGMGRGLIIPGGGIFGGGAASAPVVAGSLLTGGTNILTVATDLVIK